MDLSWGKMNFALFCGGLLIFMIGIPISWKVVASGGLMFSIGFLSELVRSGLEKSV